MSTYKQLNLPFTKFKKATIWNTMTNFSGNNFYDKCSFFMFSQIPYNIQLFFYLKKDILTIDWNERGLFMAKRIAASLVFLILLSVGISHAINDKKIENNGNASAIPVTTNQGPEIGATAPDFTLSTLDGKNVQLSNLKGKKIMLNFWTTWCPPCKAEMPDIQKFYTEAGDEIEILAVNIDTSYDVAGFVDDMKINFPVLLDKDGKVMKMYRILTIPTTYFIDKNGVIQNKIIGAMTVEKMRELTKDL